MGAKAMSSHGSGALSRQQGSVCSLTFSEVDGQLHGVNLDDDLLLLRGWSQQQQYQPTQAQRLGHHSHPAVGRPVPRPLGVGAGPAVLDALYQDGHEAGLMKRCVADGGVVERSNERRKKRMIKNRESAARSRARKQAYTNELENKIARLEEENERLRSHKALEPVVQYVPQLELKNQLRRTNSANF